jgi:hypothetical protein
VKLTLQVNVLEKRESGKTRARMPRRPNRAKRGLFGSHGLLFMQLL